MRTYSAPLAENAYLFDFFVRPSVCYLFSFACSLVYAYFINPHHALDVRANLFLCRLNMTCQVSCAASKSRQMWRHTALYLVSIQFTDFAVYLVAVLDSLEKLKAYCIQPQRAGSGRFRAEVRLLSGTTAQLWQCSMPDLDSQYLYFSVSILLNFKSKHWGTSQEAMSFLATLNLQNAFAPTWSCYFWSSGWTQSRAPLSRAAAWIPRKENWRNWMTSSFQQMGLKPSRIHSRCSLPINDGLGLGGLVFTAATSHLTIFWTK